MTDGYNPPPAASSAAAPDEITLTVGGQVYAGWTDVRITRAIDRMCSDFNISVSERWNGQRQAWQIKPFSPCTISIGRDLVMTGYVDTYAPDVGAIDHTVRITGRSKTEDLIDCMPDVPSGQFQGYKLDAIARALAAKFGIDVDVQVTPDVVLQDTAIERAETAFEFLERLARLSGVLLTDDEKGRLVLTRTGSVRAVDAIVQGGNLVRASGVLSAAKRFSIYIVKGQNGLSSYDSADVQTDLAATATDTNVPRYRPHVSIAESRLDTAGMQKRANWQASYAAGRSSLAHVTVWGWRQSNGALWRLNQLVSVTLPYLHLDQDLLIAGISYRNGRDGRVTEMTLGPPEGYTPDPGQVKLRKQKGAGGGEPNWSGAGGVS